MPKAIKYFFSLVLIIAAFLASSFFDFQNLQEFSYKYTEMQLDHQEGMNQKQLCDDIIKNAEKHHVSVYSIDTKLGNLNNDIETIYCTEGAEKILSDEAGIHAGTHKFLFIESTDVVFDAMEHLPESKSGISLRVIGDKQNVSGFTSSLLEIYDGMVLSKGSWDHQLPAFYGIWAIVFFVILIFTLFEIFSFEKEKTILIVNGTGIAPLTARKILADTVALGIIYAAAYFITSRLGSLGYQRKGALLCFLAFLVVNALCYLWMLRFDVKKGFADATDNRMTLCFLGLSKVFVSFCIIIGFALLNVSLNESLSFLRQNKFYEQNDLNYVTFIGQYDMTDPDAMIEFPEQLGTLQSQFYERHQKDVVVISQINDTGGCLMNMNSAALEIFRENLKLADKNIKVSDLIDGQVQAVLAPEGISEETLNSVKKFADLFDGDEDSELNLIKYKHFETVCMMSGEEPSAYVENPIVLLNYGYSQASKLLYRVSEEDVKSFLKSYSESPEQQKFQWDYRLNSAAAVYSSDKERVTKTALLYGGMLVLLLVITITSLICFTKMYFIMHKREFAVKYCLGYNIFQFLLVPIIVNLIVLAISCTAAGIVSLAMKLHLLQGLIYGTALVVLLDVFTLLFTYFRFIRKNIIQVLKGKAI